MEVQIRSFGLDGSTLPNPTAAQSAEQVTDALQQQATLEEGDDSNSATICSLVHVLMYWRDTQRGLSTLTSAVVTFVPVYFREERVREGMT